MSSWKQVRFSEICDITRGGSPRPIQEYMTNDGVPWIKISDATASNSRFIEKTKEFIKTSGISKSREVFPDDLILSNSATPGIPKFMRIYACIHDGWLLLRNFNGAEKEFIYWLLLNERDKLIQQGNGSVFTNLKTDILKNHIVNIPDDIEEQKRIATILNNIQEKIELNTQINQTLEQIAQTIFKSWFIDFDPVHAKANALASGQTLEQATQAAMAVISGKNTQELHRLQTANPEQYQQLWEIAEAFPSGVDEEGVPRGWEERELSSLFEFLSGAQPPKSEHIYEEKEGYERFIQNRDYSNDNHKTYIPISKKNKRCTEKDILMDKYGEAGKVRYGIKGAYNVALAKIVPQKDNLREFLRSYFTQDKIRNYLSSSSMASTRNSLNSTTFTGMKVIVPNDFLLSTFDKLANEKIDKILQIKQENIELSKLRDYLLPKLLSGEV
ncbi:restriction endonuclease subunit S [Glaesserella parasuis]|uniref:restriction endonuclease subunit S n=1 Tax=Glaesserella parasuis TaxID=738 RepID=UPI0024364CE4|nr:restriction endonuclease subunit S [Glaesserella parasuis]MDG6832347.1 restriction endonuclease subunit S [Glaesserella parasuis]